MKVCLEVVAAKKLWKDLFGKAQEPDADVTELRWRCYRVYFTVTHMMRYECMSLAHWAAYHAAIRVTTWLKSHLMKANSVYTWWTALNMSSLLNFHLLHPSWAKQQNIHCTCTRRNQLHLWNPTYSTFEDMVACDGYDHWFHVSCVDMEDAPQDDWFCADCAHMNNE